MMAFNGNSTSYENSLHAGIYVVSLIYTMIQSRQQEMDDASTPEFIILSHVVLLCYLEVSMINAVKLFISHI